MSVNLLDLLSKQVTGSLASQASGFLGESESSITNALGGIFPSLLGSAMKLGANQSGATQMMDMMVGMDDSFMDNIGGVFSGGADSVSKFSGVGSSIVKMLLGNKMGGLLDLVMGSGLKKSTAGSLLSMAAPFLIGLIKRQVMNKGVSGLMGLLGGQKDYVKAALPSKFGNVLGLGDMFGSAKETVSNVASSTVNVASNVATATIDTGKKAGGSIMKWLIPALLALLVLGYFGMKTGCSAVDNVADSVTNTTKNVVGGATDIAKKGVDVAGDAAGAVAGLTASAFGKVNEAAKATLDKITFVTGSAGDQITKFIAGGFKGDGHFKFNNLNFATGKATIQGEAGTEVDNLAAILAAYPELKIEIQGHTDNTGNAEMNKQLSQMRADAVKARLGVKGINADRVKAVGFGADNPTASNDTNEGRAANRRIEVVIVK